ncbi:cardio acceleratory peptide 2b [Adelges cooleyi]|uniref:cardio acceleratory peptide 2b n=1 Tax=Adelges cooleyi TaxID=133065 RepID=UPI00217FFF75|nr:cardio acceleratory peptide 2b [Adelges cooleyi]
MKLIHTYVTYALLLTFTLYCSTCAKHHDLFYNDELKRDINRNRRESFAGLIAFPRVGRSNMDNLRNFYEQKELSNHKREGLIPFPRIGRSDIKSSALWFGPRLGRSVKDMNSYDAYIDTDTPSIIKKMIEIKNENYPEDEENLL